MTIFLKEWDQHLRLCRPYLLSFAFRMTGSLADAEDIVQEAILECASIDPGSISNHKSWLTKVCSNKALDHLKAAYKKRESYPGTWLPDAIPDSLQVWESLNVDRAVDQNILLSESLTTSFLLIIERLSPEERVVYLLREIFDYSFDSIAQFLNKSEAACRKIAERSRKAVQEGRRKFDPGTGNSTELIREFFDLAKKGDAKAMTELLAEHSEFWADGGGKVSATASVIFDPAKIAAFFASLGSSKIFRSDNHRQELAQVNHRPGVILSRQLDTGDWVMETVISFEIQDGKIARIYAQRNPDKLRALMA